MPGRHLTALLLACARSGDLDGLLELVDADPEAQPHEVAYTWLWVAAGFGHDRAHELIKDLRYGGPMRDDDDGYLGGEAHLRLALGYLTGEHGLPVDHTLAGQHLARMLTFRYPAHVENGAQVLAKARDSLDPAALAVFDAALAG